MAKLRSAFFKPDPINNDHATFTARWADQTCTLIDEFKRDLERQCGPNAAEYVNEGLVHLTAMFLLASFDDQASWERLDILDMLRRCVPAAPSPRFHEALITTLGAFYCFLGKTGRVSPEMHRRMRQLSILCVTIGATRALDQYRLEQSPHRDTMPAFGMSSRRHQVH